jgi:hypothetical protein
MWVLYQFTNGFTEEQMVEDTCPSSLGQYPRHWHQGFLAEFTSVNFPFPDSAPLGTEGIRLRKYVVSQSKRTVHQPLGSSLGLLCRDALQTHIPTGFIGEAGGTPCQAQRHIFITLRYQGNFYT